MMPTVPKAATARTDWSGVVETALEFMVVVGIIEQPELEVLHAPSWREAAVEYHRDRAGRLAVEIEPKRLAQLRRLVADDVSLERAYHDISRNGPAPSTLVEALMLSLRRGVTALIRPDTQRRLSALDKDQLEAVCLRVQAFQPTIAPAWSVDDTDLLISIWKKLL
jgi:hypothetical protein